MKRKIPFQTGDENVNGILGIRQNGKDENVGN